LRVEQAHGGLCNECPIAAGSGGALLVVGATIVQKRTARPETSPLAWAEDVPDGVEFRWRSGLMVTRLRR
jgi:hypothetical protein